MPEVIRFLVTAVGGAAVGATIVFALSSWLGKVWANRILEKDRAHYRHEVDSELHRLKDQLDRGQFIHKLQFEKEFNSYVDLWAQVVEVRNSALRIRPTIDDPILPDKSRWQVIKERLVTLNQTLHEFRIYYAKHRPFLAPKVYWACNKLDQVANEESLAFEYKNLRDVDEQKFWEDAEANAAGIIHYTEGVCDAIRERIGIVGLPDPMKQPAPADKPDSATTPA